jgi:eukaryotic-like serine/threonine-protein kinase
MGPDRDPGTVPDPEAKMAVTELAVGVSLGDGRYRLREMLGTGGMASVWLADDTRLRRPVAIKVLADSLALDPGYVSRFEREAHIAARLSHPNLVGVFDFSGAGRRPYLVMEYVPGGTLADRLRAHRRESWDPQAVLCELASALAHVHAAGIIHRDIKPANVLIGPDGRARLTDFGVARPSDAERLTRTGLVVGTARYIDPEVMRGQQPDERSDLYACGVLLHECLREGDPQHLRALVDRLTSEQPEERPASAAEVLELLDQTCTAATAVITSKPASEASTKPTPVAGSRFRSVRSRPGTVAVAAGAIVLILVVLLIVLSTGGSGGGRSASSHKVARPSASAGLNAQLGYLDSVIAQARR